MTPCAWSAPRKQAEFEKNATAIRYVEKRVMEKHWKFLIPGALLAVALLWSGTTVLTDAHAGLLPLRGGDECDCNSCENGEPVETDECLHTSASPDPNGGAPVPDPNDPNSMWDPSNNACSADYCIRNSDYYASCDTMAGGPDCPMHEDPNLFWDRQEMFDNAPADCASPNYDEVDMSQECAGVSGSAWCVVGSCGGAGSTKLDPNTYNQDEYRGGDGPGSTGRMVCDD
jgi:hypothetical protein